MKNALAIINNNLETIKQACIEAYKQAFKHQYMQYMVWIDETGNVYTYQSTPGNSFIPIAIYEGKGTEITRFCFEGWESEIDYQQIEQRFAEKGKEKDFAFYDEIFDGSDEGIEHVINTFGNAEAKAILRELHTEEEEGFLEFAEEVVDEKLEYRIQEAEEMEE